MPAGFPASAYERGFPGHYDLFKFEDQFSALLIIQQLVPSAVDNVMLFDTRWEEVRRDCGVRTWVYEAGVEAAAFVKTKHFMHARSHNLSAAAGDLYIFNSNQIYWVTPVGPGDARIVLGSFVGFSQQEVRVWS